MSDSTVIQVTPDGESIVIHEKESADLWLDEPLGARFATHVTCEGDVSEVNVTPLLCALVCERCFLRVTFSRQLRTVSELKKFFEVVSRTK